MTHYNEETKLLGQFIPLHYHYQMLLDQARMQGFKAAISKLVPPGGTVIDLGGGTGVLSFFAAQKAAKIWCVERNPQMAEAARNFMALNRCADKVEVVEADACDFVPPTPVDTVICEMLHSALLREKQVEVIEAFKQNYRRKFSISLQLPTFIPEATILAAQAVDQNFNFAGFRAPLPMFFEPTAEQNETNELGDPVVYATVEYRKNLPSLFKCDITLPITQAGTCNAVRFVTKNILAILVDKNSTIDWHNFYLVLPLKQEISVRPGDSLSVHFNYKPGGALETLLESLKVSQGN